MASKFNNNFTNVIYPNWEVPVRVKAFTTTSAPINHRLGYTVDKDGTFNLASHTGDDLDGVSENRKTLIQEALPSAPTWLSQCHSDIAIELPIASIEAPIADAAFTSKINTVCAILTADCMPILLTNIKGSKVAAIHAGWQGLVNGVIESSVKALNIDPDQLICWMGPSIGVNDTFEIASDTLGELLKFNPQASKFIKANPNSLNKWFADLPKLAAQRLEFLGVNPSKIYFSGCDTFEDKSRFFSFRRNNSKSRMATCIWIEN